MYGLGISRAAYLCRLFETALCIMSAGRNTVAGPGSAASAVLVKSSASLQHWRIVGLQEVIFFTQPQSFSKISRRQLSSLYNLYCTS